MPQIVFARSRNASGRSLKPDRSLAIGRPVRHAKIRQAIRDLPFRRPQRIRAFAVRLELPAHDFRLRKPAAQFRDDFWRRHQFDEQVAVACGDFFGWPERLQLSRRIAREHFAEGEITHRRRMKDGVHFFAGKRFQLRPQIRRGGIDFDRLRLAFARISRRLADEQRDLVAARGEEIGEFRAEPARGKIRSRRTSSSGSNVGPAVTMQFMLEFKLQLVPGVRQAKA